jgi:hypothetical protein
MYGSRHRGEVDDARTSLQSVKRAERGVERFAAFRRHFERQKISRRLLDEFARFQAKLFKEFVHVAAPQSNATCAFKTASATGLTR